MAERKLNSELFSLYFVVYLSFKGITAVISFKFLKFVKWIGAVGLIMEKWLEYLKINNLSGKRRRFSEIDRN